MTDPKGTWSDGGKVWEGEPQALAATRNVLAMTTDEHLAATPAVGGEMVLHPLSEIREWDEALAELGIQDSTTTPAEAVRALNAELEELRAALPASPLRGREWQHISTAPKDGSTIEVRYVSDDPRRVRWSQSRSGSGWHLTDAFAGAIITFDPTEWRSASPPEQPAAVTGRVTGTEYAGNQVRGMPGAICHACGLKDYPCVNPDCPNRPSEPELPAARPMGQS